MQFGSLVNQLSGSKKGVKPTVGMGVTFLFWSDRAPGTIVEVINDKTIVVQGDNYKRVDDNGMSECQRYKFSRNPKAGKGTFTLRKNGRWVQKGYGMKQGQVLAIGHRDAYHDFSF